MKRHVTSLLLVLALCLGLAMPAAAAEGEKVTVGDQTYEALLQAILSETEADSVTARLDSDVTLTATVVIGSSDYDGLFSEPMTVTAKNVTVDLNGHSLTAAKDSAMFEVQAGYTLTIVDNSEAKTGKLVTDVETAVVDEGATYNPLPAAAEETPAEETPAEETPAEETPAEETPANPFTDVAETSAYYDGILWAVKEGITTGRTATTFVPGENCTEANILTFLWRAQGEPKAETTENPFGEAVSTEAYYYGAALWAFEKGMIDATFAPNTPCTRAQAVTFMWQAAGKPEAEAATFTDVAADADYAAAVNWAVAQNVTKGTGDGTTFSPDTVCTRGQIATFLYRADAASTETAPAGETEAAPTEETTASAGETETQPAA